MSGGGWIVAGPLIIDLAEVKRITQVDDVHRLDRELDHLRALELMPGFDIHTQRANVTPTSLCLQFYMRCKGHRGSPLEFYIVKDPDAQLDEQFGSQVDGKVPKASGKTEDI